MTSKELKAAKERRERPKRKAAKKLHDAGYYLYTSTVPESTLTPAMRILRICEQAARRGWMYPEEITKMAKLTGREHKDAAAVQTGGR